LFKSKKTAGLFLTIGITFFMAGCFPDTPVVPAPTATITPVPTMAQEEEILIGPTKEEVLIMRETVLEGMDQNAIDRLTENIKIANLTMEEAYLYDDLFGKLEDKEHLYWNYFDEKEEIQIGVKEDGMPITTYNRFDADNFIDLMSEMKESVHHEGLRNDLQYIIDETRLAKETHEVEHANNIYKALHDMDYFLLRYGLEDVGQYVKDKAVLAKYYGVLSVYQDIENP